MNRIRYQCAMGDTIASQLVRHDPPWLAATPFDQTPEEALCRFPVSPRLQKHIHNFTILINRTPQILLSTVNLDENFIDIESVPKAVVFSPQAPSISRSKFYAPQADRFVSDPDPAFGE